MRVKFGRHRADGDKIYLLPRIVEISLLKLKIFLTREEQNSSSNVVIDLYHSFKNSKTR